MLFLDLFVISFTKVRLFLAMAEDKLAWIMLILLNEIVHSNKISGF